MRRFVSQVRELCAGAAFALAGFSSGRGDCARGGWAAGRCVPVGMFCARLTLAARFCWNVLRSSHARRAVLSRCFALNHARRAFLLECSALASRPPCIPVGMFCARSRPPCGSIAVFCARLTPAVHSCWNVLRSSHARRAVLSRCSALDHVRRAVLLGCSALDPPPRSFRLQ